MTGLVILGVLLSGFVAGCVFTLGKMIQAAERRRAETWVQRRVSRAGELDTGQSALGGDET